MGSPNALAGSGDRPVLSDGHIELQNQHAPVHDNTAPPDGGYGWVCVLACFLINGFTWGIIASYGVYLSYYISNSTFSHASPLDYSFVGGSNFAAAMLTTFPTMALYRCFGPRVPMLLGCVTFASGFVAASFATKFWHLCLSQGVLVGIGVGLVWIPSISILPQWFSKKRSLANGIASGGSGIGGLIFSLATTPAIENLSLAWSLRITGIAAFVVLATATFLVRDRNHIIRPKQRSLDFELLRRYEVLLLSAWGFTNLLGYTTLLYSLGDFARGLGLSQSQGSTIIAILNLGTAIGRPFIGVLSDKYGRITVAGILTVFNSFMTFVMWIPAESFAVVLVYALIVGATLGIYWTSIGPLCAEVVGLKNLPSMLSLSWLTVVLPTFFSEAIALELRRPGSGRPYLFPQLYTGLTYFVASLFLLELRRVRYGLRKSEKNA